MKWSYSASRSFRQCQKQWYFKNIVASSRGADPLRHKAYLLSKLQSVSAWRGNIVDAVISKTIIPCIRRGMRVTLNDAKAKAKELFDGQLEFARCHTVSNLTLPLSKYGDVFALFYDREYKDGISEKELTAAWQDVEAALANLFSLGAVKDLLKGADYIVPQRALQFPLMDNVTVLAYPDVIAFQKDQSPAIVDWKVHVFGQNDAWLQLAIYAISLSRCKPHADFPSPFNVEPQGLRLFEAQLLTNALRQHSLDEDHIVEAEEYMISSAYEMTCLTDGTDPKDLAFDDFLPALSPESCQRCAFRGICWEGQNVH